MWWSSHAESFHSVSIWSDAAYLICTPSTQHSYRTQYSQIMLALRLRCSSKALNSLHAINDVVAAHPRSCGIDNVSRSNNQQTVYTRLWHEVLTVLLRIVLGIKIQCDLIFATGCMIIGSFLHVHSIWACRGDCASSCVMPSAFNSKRWILSHMRINVNIRW